MPQQPDRDVNRALRQRFDDVRSQYERLRAGMGEMQERIAALTVTAESRNGLVRATVGPRGHLVDLKLDRELCRETDPEELSRTILRTVEQAVAQSTEQVQNLMTEFLPADSGAPAFHGDGDFNHLLGRQDRIMREADDTDAR